ncbi:MAG: oligosaccharide flippase family protein [Myxococcales bacterium]|nr:oligosaccharide flippase family protein [Myxococcales bacterium]
MSDSNVTGKSLGGGAWLGLAKLWFLVAGYGLNVALTHLIAEDTFGQYQTVARAVAVPNMVIIYTVMFAISRPLSAEFDDGVPNFTAIRRHGLRLAIVLGLVASGTVFLAAPALAGWWNDEALVTPLYVVAPISLVYALYAVNVGTLNALRRFSRQAALDITMATLKTGFMAAAAAVALGLTWIVAGFTAAAVCSLLLSVVLVARSRPDAKPSTGVPSMARFAAALIVFTAVLNLLQSADLMILSSYSDTEVLKKQTGYYSSAQLVAWVPYSLMNAVVLVAFPFVASFVGSGVSQQTRTYVGSVATTTLSLLALMSAVAAAAAAEVQSLLFPQAYSVAAVHLQLLVFGYSGYSFANTVAWMCNSAGRNRIALIIVSVPLSLAVPLALALCPEHHAGGAAIAVAIAGAGATAAGFVGLRLVFGVTPPWLHLLKLGAAAGLVFLVGTFVDVPTGGLTGKLMIVGKLGLLAATFVAVALATRAVTVAQIPGLRRR